MMGLTIEATPDGNMLWLAAPDPEADSEWTRNRCGIAPFGLK
jgi:hypothetical protein